MSQADGPIEFKSVRPGRSPATWLAERSRRDAQVYAGFALLLIPCGIAATAGLFAVTFVVLHLLNLVTCGVWRPLVALLAAGVVAGLFVAGAKLTRDGRRRIDVLLPTRGVVELRLSRLTGNSWMMLFENADEMNFAVRGVLNAALLSPRLFLMSRRTWRLARRMREVDPDTTGRAVELLMSSGKRVSLVELLEEFPLSDPQRLLDDLAAIDGVVLLLTADEPGLTVTPSFVEEYESWRKRPRKRRRAD